MVFSNNFFYQNGNFLRINSSLLKNGYYQIKELSVHFLINKIRFWDINTKFFITTKIFKYLNVNIRNRLKNIFIQVVNDNSIWLGLMLVNLLLTLHNLLNLTFCLISKTFY